VNSGAISIDLYFDHSFARFGEAAIIHLGDADSPNLVNS